MMLFRIQKQKISSLWQIIKNYLWMRRYGSESEKVAYFEVLLEWRTDWISTFLQLEFVCYLQIWKSKEVWTYFQKISLEYPQSLCLDVTLFQKTLDLPPHCR
jgi:hypothetical protein